MSWIKITFISAALLSSPWVIAQAAPTNTAETQTVKSPSPPPYGDNPNIFRVLAHKTKESVQETAEKVGDSAEKGLEKIKPQVDQAWDTVTAKNSRAVPVPIERKALSQSSSNAAAETMHIQPKVGAQAKTNPLAKVEPLAKPESMPTSELAPKPEPTTQAEPVPKTELAPKSNPAPKLVADQDGLIRL